MSSELRATAAQISGGITLRGDLCVKFTAESAAITQGAAE
jgi:hypothetical protein